MKHAVRIMVMAAMLLILAVPVEAATKTTRLSATSIAMDAGTKTKIKLVKYKKLSKKQLKKVKWTSSNKKVATVKASGAECHDYCEAFGENHDQGDIQS